ncbi:Homoserine kinase [hydrothermal vent metagenome]|uniref:Homoserine kinase n=1 Tax=hydrothermal vent metagenome TaxID=652676 RepID=A0A3B1BVN3_9ZZZZ
MTHQHAKVVVDARRLLCPMPVIRVQDKIKELNVGAIVEAICTDPGALHDIPAWCRINGHTVLSSVRENDEYLIIIEVGE